MIALIVIAVLILLIFFLPYGVDAAYENAVLRLSVKAGPLRFRLLPKKEKAHGGEKRKKKKKPAEDKKKEEKPPKEKKEKSGKKDGKKSGIKKLLSDPEAIAELVGILLRAVKRLFRSFTLDLFRLRFTAGAGDPFETVRLYSLACGAIDSLAPLAGSVVRCRNCAVETNLDFERESADIEGRIVVSLQLYKLVVLAVCAAFAFLKWKKRAEKRARVQ